MLRGRRQSWPALAGLVTALALLAMMVRVAVPPGYMFAPTRDGNFITVTFCTAHGASTSLMDLQTGEIVGSDRTPKKDAPEDGAQKDAPCVFAAAGTFSGPETAPTLAIFLYPVEAQESFAFAQTPGRGLAAPPPWSTGPPPAI